MQDVVKIDHLTKFYGAQRGIEDVNLAIGEGEIFGFIGPNGAGKSTTIRCLLALIRPSGGSATLFGKDCIRCADEIAREVGYLPSEVFYYENMRVRDLLAYAASFYKKDCAARIRALCDALELDPSRKIDDLSFGNRKKVGIVQGLLHSPRLIFLDEPTSGLDPLMQNRFFDLIRAENRAGATIFFSSHILSEVQKLCDRVGFIKDGRILQVEKISALRENSYKRVTMEFSEPVLEAALALEGAAQLRVDGLRASFIYKGGLGDLTRRLAFLPLSDLEIAEPDLEEIFLNYYA